MFNGINALVKLVLGKATFNKLGSTAILNTWMMERLKYLSKKIKISPSQLVAVAVILTLLVFLPQIYITLQADYKFKTIVKHELRLQSLSNEITYLDEVLTMSAKMNAATGDKTWETRYREFEPKLDTAIKESISLASEAYNTKDAKETDQANQNLVAMEYESFKLVDNNQSQAAQSLLSSKEYINQKEIYALGVSRRNAAILLQVENKISEYRRDLLYSILISIISLVLIIPVWLLVLSLLRTYLKARNSAQRNLEEINQNLESLVWERTKDLTDKNLQMQETLQKLEETQLLLIQTEKMSSLGQMLAGIAHEINNPINFINGNIIHLQKYGEDLLKLIDLYQKNYSNPTAEIKNYIQDIDLNYICEDYNNITNSISLGTSRIIEIVTSLRNFSRLDQQITKKVDIHQGIDATLMILSHRLKATDKRGEIKVIKDYNSLPLIECYPAQLNQVFMNILANAIDALEDYDTQRDQDEIKKHPSQIKITTDVINDNEIVIYILDNGAGIPADIMNQLFNPFFSTKPIGKGTGLGLSISQQIIVDKHGGHLFCESITGRGTEFQIKIPVAQD
ncbi:sensor histidine kinase [Calothrix sp. PCC 6303]|uniref:sensor histidine kinase n=1 Tax=Calothrix sp. PCC 6303 TaxID=1170562 RepID=UPI0002A0063C|nr:ATP-binding protein [Calothrix sp. PCC 6303]AFY99816.1 integral membrane sensor signal transduction histidine kinase [Calothrix sp. PCC 6303]